MLSLLVVTPDQETVDVLRSTFSKARFEAAASHESLKRLLSRRHADFLFIDLHELLAGRQAIEAQIKAALTECWQLCPSMQIVVLTKPQDLRAAIDAVRAGAANYLARPVHPAEAQLVVQKLAGLNRLESELSYYRGAQHKPQLTFDSLNPVMQQVLHRASMVAPTRTTVLLTGETGTGKSVMARYIHAISGRRDKPFISVHCGAMPDTLLESELFGHEKGAFTGASRRKLGKFELASAGTIFLDEVGSITPSAQIKLLQVLQERRIQRVGGETDIDVDVRILAAANADLEEMVAQGLFRRDLFFRLNVFPLELPPLRQRYEDIPLIVEGFLRKLEREYPKNVHGVHPKVLEVFSRYSWPGNVRELENLVERAFILENSHLLTPESFPGELFLQQTPAATIPLDVNLSLRDFRERAKENAERQYLKELLHQCNGRINKSAEKAGITSRQLHKLLTKYSIDKSEYK